MRPGLDKSIVAYGPLEHLPTYGKVEAARHGRTRLVRTAGRRGHLTIGDIYMVEFSLSATAATVPVSGICASQVVLHAAGTPFRDCIIFEADMMGSWLSHSQEAPENEDERLRSAVLEMRPARRSLRDKAREELSGFEREYPW